MNLMKYLELFWVENRCVLFLRVLGFGLFGELSLLEVHAAAVFEVKRPRLDALLVTRSAQLELFTSCSLSAAFGFAEAGALCVVAVVVTMG